MKSIPIRMNTIGFDNQHDEKNFKGISNELSTKGINIFGFVDQSKILFVRK